MQRNQARGTAGFHGQGTTGRARCVLPLRENLVLVLVPGAFQLAVVRARGERHDFRARGGLHALRRAAAAAEPLVLVLPGPEAPTLLDRDAQAVAGLARAEANVVDGVRAAQAHALRR